MVSSEFRKSIAHGYLFLARLNANSSFACDHGCCNAAETSSNVLNTVKIEKVVLPDVVQSGSTDVVVDCQFAVSGEPFTLQWWFSGGDRAAMVYEWTPRLPPKVAGVLEGRLDPSYRASTSPTDEHRAFRLLKVDPELSGEYTCVLIKNGIQVREAKRMLVFRPEEELELTVEQNLESKNFTEITCFAFGVYPQPDLILEYNKQPIAQQVQRVWRRSSLMKYDTECKAQLRVPECGQNPEVTCRLYLQQADYTAIKKKFLSLGDQCNQGQRTVQPITFLYLFLFHRISVGFITYFNN